jgi:hypothetical protein
MGTRSKFFPALGGGGITSAHNLTVNTNSDVQSLFLVNIWREGGKTTPSESLHLKKFKYF